jgi:PEP-CTERM motif-containing protein
MKKAVWLAITLLAVSSASFAESVAVSGDGNTGVCVIPDGSTVTTVSVTPNSSPKLNVYEVDYTFAGGYGESTAVGETDGHDGTITFLQPVYDLSFSWDGPTAFGATLFDGQTVVGGAGDNDTSHGYSSPTEVQGTSSFDGPVTFINWSGDIFGGGIESLSFDLSPNPVPEPSVLMLLAVGLAAVFYARTKSNFRIS